MGLKFRRIAIYAGSPNIFSQVNVTVLVQRGMAHVSFNGQRDEQAEQQALLDQQSIHRMPELMLKPSPSTSGLVIG
ncbi:hypothetical protein XBLMG947_3689 [Xanthomonas bromi]|uniref:Uncharacterized protein n=1 Tax=Xanthomonas bromi TaxID=56449 RepID=A0A1C3NRD3_9XANT|nr:hypothetical protein [Xanthomonas bromi]PPV05187.1 hypothetical protein XbrCFBP1976_18335 [Xanthomonas bromi]SBV52888.1 hypothetical protein XBLMG947_3689 [Xanthomonas bromi]